MSGKSGEMGREDGKDPSASPSLGACVSVSVLLSPSLPLLHLFACLLSLSLSPAVHPLPLTLLSYSVPLSLSHCLSLSPTLTTAHLPLSRQGSAGPAGLAGLRAAAAMPRLRAGALGAALLLGAGGGPRVGPLRGAGQGGAWPHPAGAGPPRVGGAWQWQRRLQQQQRGLRSPLRRLCVPHALQKRPPAGTLVCAVELGPPHPEPS